MLRLLGVLLAAALISALAFGACVSACGVAVVSVVAAEGPNVVAPVPLMLPLAALRFAPDHLLWDEVPKEFEDWGAPGLVALGEAFRILEDVEDTVLVQITDGDDQVVVASESGDLVVRVQEGGDAPTRVLVRAPLAALREAAEACEETGEGVRCNPRQLARSLLSGARGTEITVRDGDTRVDVQVW